MREHQWIRITNRAWGAFRADKATLLASGIAFRATLAIFPAVGVLVWFASYFISSDQVYSALQSVTGTLPESTRDIIGQAIGNQRADGSGDGGGRSSFGIAGPLLSLSFALWSANSGVKALFAGLNAIFGQTEGRSFTRLLLTTLAFTIGALALSLSGIALVVTGPHLLALTGTSEEWLTAWRYLRWPLFFVVSAISLSILYTYAPNHHRGRRSFVTAGGLAASLALTGAAATFSWFIQNFAGLSLTYGPLSTFIAFMIWLWLTFTLVLAGAELDAAVAHETADGPAGNVERHR